MLERARAPFPGCRTCCAAGQPLVYASFALPPRDPPAPSRVRRAGRAGLSGAGPCVAGIPGGCALGAGCLRALQPFPGQTQKMGLWFAGYGRDTPGAEERQVRMAGEGWTRQEDSGNGSVRSLHPRSVGVGEVQSLLFPIPQNLRGLSQDPGGRCGAEPAGDLGFRLCSAGSSLAFRGLCSLPVPGCSHQRGGAGRSRLLGVDPDSHCRLDPLLVDSQLPFSLPAVWPPSKLPAFPCLLSEALTAFASTTTYTPGFLSASWATFSVSLGHSSSSSTQTFLLKKILSFIYSLCKVLVATLGILIFIQHVGCLVAAWEL